MEGSAFDRTGTTEWPTVLAIVGFWIALVATLLVAHALPTVLTVVLLALLSGFYMSLQHEVIHGHPTPWRTLNRASVGAPLVLIQPFERYSAVHTAHHASDITNPIDDPESFYVTPEAWRQARILKRWFLLANRTLLARLTIGPVYSSWQMVRYDVRLMRHQAGVRRTWAVHVLAAALVVAAVRMTGTPLWVYALGFVYGGMVVTSLRSFVEHRAVGDGQTRSAVVQSGRFFGLLYLNNNLHHAHHSLPGAAWYRLPQISRDLDSPAIATDGAGFYRGYFAIARAYMFRPFEQPVNPLLEKASA
ncbi:MAG: fatty acid desaturase [Ilumatobacteraceae bacterium]|nr:fatty acid desaturase [Ilumatobacteraceae bacterium]